MDVNYVIALAAGLVLSGLSLIGLFYLVKNLLGKVQGYPNEVEIEEALRPFVVKAIQASYKTAENILEKFEQTLTGADKKKIADNLYAKLPATIVINGKEYDIQFVKSIVSKERWSEMVQNAFDAGVTWTDAFQQKLIEEALELIEEVNGE